MRVVPSLVWARLRHRPLRLLLVVLGMATATVLPVVAQGSATVVAAQALRHGIADLPAGQRSVIVSYAGVVLSQRELDRLDAAPRQQLARLSSPVHRQLLFRRIADAKGGSFFLGAGDDLMSSVRLTSGRAPTSCTPVRCEVVVVGQGTPALDPTLGIVIVGRAVRTDPLLLTGTFDPGHDAPLLLADGVAAAQRLASLEQFQRSYGWVTPLDLDRVLEGLGVDRYLALSADVADKLFRADPGLILTAPDLVLQSQAARAQLSSRRFALLSGAGTALLLGFAVIAAIGLRRDQLALLELLRRRGAGKGTTRLVTTLEAAVPVLAGTVLGLAVGGAIAAATASGAGLPAPGSALSAVGGAVPAAVAAASLATLIVVITSSWAVGAQARTAWRVVDAAVVVGLGTAALAISRG